MNTNGSYWYSINKWHNSIKQYEVRFFMTNIKIQDKIITDDPIKYFETKERAMEYKDDMIKQIQLYNTFPENSTWVENYDDEILE